MERLEYIKTGTVHIVEYFGTSQRRHTLCALNVDDENWNKPSSPISKKMMCKRCLVASGVPGRDVYNYGPMAWKKGYGG